MLNFPASGTATSTNDGANGNGYNHSQHSSTTATWSSVFVNLSSPEDSSCTPLALPFYKRCSSTRQALIKRPKVFLIYFNCSYKCKNLKVQSKNNNVAYTNNVQNSAPFVSVLVATCCKNVLLLPSPCILYSLENNCMFTVCAYGCKILMMFSLFINIIEGHRVDIYCKSSTVVFKATIYLLNVKFTEEKSSNLIFHSLVRATPSTLSANNFLAQTISSFKLLPKVSLTNGL